MSFEENPLSQSLAENQLSHSLTGNPDSMSLINNPESQTFVVKSESQTLVENPESQIIIENPISLSDDQIPQLSIAQNPMLSQMSLAPNQISQTIMQNPISQGSVIQNTISYTQLQHNPIPQSLIQNQSHVQNQSHMQNPMPQSLSMNSLVVSDRNASKYKIGARIIGKSKRHRDKIGSISDIIVDQGTKKYKVTWNDGKIEDVSPSAVGIYSEAAIARALDISQGRVPEPYLPDNLGSDDCRSEISVDELQFAPLATDEGRVVQQTGPPTSVNKCYDNQQWEDITEIIEEAEKGATVDSKLLWPEEVAPKSAIKKPIDYFNMFFPRYELDKILAYTNEMMMYKKFTPPLEMKDILRWLGIHILGALEKNGGNFKQNWSSGGVPGRIMRKGNYGERCKMSYERFSEIESALRLADFLEDYPAQDDPWLPIRGFINSFNANMREKLSPCSYLAIGESVSSFEGVSGEYCSEGPLSGVKIVRKLDAAGTEFTTIADGDTGCVLAIELQESKDKMAFKEFTNECGSSTAGALRLAIPFFDTERTIIGSNIFTSLETLIELRKRGLNFMGNVKPPTSGYPYDQLREWYDSGKATTTGVNGGGRTTPKLEVGSHKVLRTKFSAVENKDSIGYAIGWKDDRLITIITNRGTTRQGTPTVHQTQRRMSTNFGYRMAKSEVTVRKPQAIELLQKYSTVIDSHNRARQDTLGLEHHWKTTTWWHRPFSTVLGIAITNAYYGYRYENKRKSTFPDHGLEDFVTFADKLCFQLIFNDLSIDMAGGRDNSAAYSGTSTPIDRTHHEANTSMHHLRLLRNEPKHQNRSRATIRCRVCSKSTTLFCRECSRPLQNKYYGVCNPWKESETDCYFVHT